MKNKTQEHTDDFDKGWDLALKLVISKLQLKLHKDEIELIKSMMIKQKDK